MSQPKRDEETKRLQNVGRVLDSRWMMALAVSAVLVAIVWALLDKRIGPPASGLREAEPVATVELLGVPEGAEVLLDGREIQNQRFGVTPGTRHLLEVRDAEGRSWRQVFLASGSLSLVVDLRMHFTEIEVPPNE